MTIFDFMVARSGLGGKSRRGAAWWRWAALLLGAAATAHASYTLRWTPRDYFGDETGFAIERSDAGAPFVQIAIVPSGTATTYQDTSANNPIVYAYRVRAFNAVGIFSNYTGAVTNAPTFTSQPTAAQTVMSGNNATLSAVAVGIPSPTFQWQLSTDSGSSWTIIADGGVYSGSATGSLSITGATAAMNGDEYRILAISSAAPGGIPSSSTTLTVDSVSMFSAAPTGQTVVAGHNVTFTAAVVGYPVPALRWQYSPDAGADWGNLSDGGVYSGTGTGSLTLTNVIAGMNGYEFRVVASSSLTPSGVASSAATLTVATLPIFNFSPTSQAQTAGGSVSFAAGVSGNPAPTLQWKVSVDGGVTFNAVADGALYSGTATASLLIRGVTAAMNGYEYAVMATNLASPGGVSSSLATLSINTPPVFVTSPASQTVGPGSTVAFTASATGNPACAYQWQYSPAGGPVAWVNLSNGGVYAGVATASLGITGATAGLNGNLYRVIATNAAGGTPSSGATLTINAALAASSPVVVTAPPVSSPPVSAPPRSTPVVSLPPVSTPVVAPVTPASPASDVAPSSSQTVAPGGTIALNAPVTGNSGSTYQWEFNGLALAGATGARLVLTNASAPDAGTYTCVDTDARGATTSTGTAVSIVSTTDIGRLTNLSVLNQAGSTQLLTLGFVVGGAGTSGSEPLLIRASGPALTAFGIANVLADPTLNLFQGSASAGSNDNWGATAANQAAVTAATAADFAFPLTNPTSLDAAMVTSMRGNSSYSIQVGGNGPSLGAVIAEIYDSTPAGTYTPAMPRLVNLSCLTNVAASGSLTAGFIIGGATSKTVLIRATGPALAGFGISGVMPDPQLSLHGTVSGEDRVLAFNAGWAGDPEITAADTAAGAFALTDSASRDSAVLITLPPGAYTAQVASASGTAGTTMIEVYEMP